MLEIKNSGGGGQLNDVLRRKTFYFVIFYFLLSISYYLYIFFLIGHVGSLLRSNYQNAQCGYILLDMCTYVYYLQSVQLHDVLRRKTFLFRHASYSTLKQTLILIVKQAKHGFELHLPLQKISLFCCETSRFCED